MPTPFPPHEAGAIAWQAGDPLSANPHKFGTREHASWNAGWEAEQNAWEDAEDGFETGLVAPWVGSFEQQAEARALGFASLD